MSKIRAKNTQPEIILRKELSKRHYKLKSNYKKLFGTPDIVLLHKRVVIFIDGTFWHGYKWKEKKRSIKSNRTYWIPKIESNIRRDKKINRKLKKDGWKVIRIWEHQIKKDLPGVISKIKSVL